MLVAKIVYCKTLLKQIHIIGSRTLVTKLEIVICEYKMCHSDLKRNNAFNNVESPGVQNYVFIMEGPGPFARSESPISSLKGPCEIMISN